MNPPNLLTLSLNHNRKKIDLKEISKNKRIRTLLLQGNDLENIDYLSSMTIKTLNIGSSTFENLDFLLGLDELATLWIPDSNLGDLSAVNSLPKLKNLYLDRSIISGNTEINSSINVRY